MKRQRALVQDEGNILILSVVMVALLIASGMGYMKWAVNERWDSAFEEATVQAYFLAQTGLIEKGLQYLRTREPQDLPQGTVVLTPGYIPGVGSYHSAYIRRVTELSGGSVFQRTDTYDVFATGRAEFVNHELGSKQYGDKVPVDRTATMRTRLRSFANYMYLTKYEKTIYDEVIWFWEQDTLYGRVHSNDYIGLLRRPVFYGPVSTSQDRFIERNANPYFEYDPMFNVAPVYFPETANSIRNAAASSGKFISSRDGQFMTRLILSEIEILAYQYPMGTPFSFEEAHVVFRQDNPVWDAIFVDGEVEIYGTMRGCLTIGSAGNMWLIDNIQYFGSDPDGQFEEESMFSILGLVSEKNIIIKDTFANGRANQTQGASIVITAGMVALGESFTFENQNDDWDLYQGPTPDERGTIHLKGAVTQVRRGYVHRSNHIGTGYGKDYHYDFRFDRRPPPYYLEAVDENGHGLFDIVSWGEVKPGT